MLTFPLLLKRATIGFLPSPSFGLLMIKQETTERFLRGGLLISVVVAIFWKHLGLSHVNVSRVDEIVEIRMSEYFACESDY